MAWERVLSRSEYPDQEEFLNSGSTVEWIDRKFLRLDPFAFNACGGSFDSFRFEIADSLGVFPNGVFIVGSGAVGLSLNPNKIVDGRMRTFDQSSDLDVAVISDVHFEQAWRDLRELGHQAFNPQPSRNLSDRIKHQRKRLFDGAIVASSLLSRLSFGADWSTIIQATQLRLGDEFSRRIETNIWIYKDYWSVRAHIAEGVVKCRNRVAMP